MKKQKRMIWGGIWFSILFVIWLLLSYNAKAPGNIEIAGEKEILELSTATYVSGYMIENENIVPINNDPQIDFNNLNKELSIIQIVFAKPLEEDTVIQIYYAIANDALAEANSWKTTVSKGKKEVFIPLERQCYREIRIDINAVFSLKEIAIGTGAVYSKSIEQTDILMAFFLTVVSFLLFIALKKEIEVKKSKESLVECIKKDRVIAGVTFLFLLTYCYFLGKSLLTFDELGKQWYAIFLGVTVGGILFSILFMRKQLAGREEIAFMIICVLLGSYLVVTMPMGAVAWDDQTHYQRALALSHISDDDYITFGEYKYLTPIIEDVQDAAIVSAGKIELKNAVGIYRNPLTINKYACISYIPSALAMFLGRAFLMPWHSVYYMGRLGMVVLYSVLIYGAIKRLKSGKMILAVIALIPTNLFLTASYSYDPWVTALMISGISYILSELQQPEKKMSTKEVVGMLLSFFLMGSAKAIYFPMVALAFFVGKGKFNNLKEYKGYCFSVATVILLLVLSYAIPCITGTNDMTDIRGGSDVNGIEQIKFILKNPLDYAKILFNFLKDYMSITGSEGYMTFFAYLGHGVKFEIVLILLGIVTVTDKNEYDLKISYLYKYGTIILVLITTVLVATALYISFTPVAAEYIAGCQPRYLMPLLFPVLCIAGSKKIVNQINKTYYVMAVYGVMLYVIANCFWKNCVMLY